MEDDLIRFISLFAVSTGGETIAWGLAGYGLYYATNQKSANLILMLVLASSMHIATQTLPTPSMMRILDVHIGNQKLMNSLGLSPEALLGNDFSDYLIGVVQITIGFAIAHFIFRFAIRKPSDHEAR